MKFSWNISFEFRHFTILNIWTISYLDHEMVQMMCTIWYGPKFWVESEVDSYETSRTSKNEQFHSQTGWSESDRLRGLKLTLLMIEKFSTKMDSWKELYPDIYVLRPSKFPRTSQIHV